jgi:flagellar basal-body rod modification protein FlgD
MSISSVAAGGVTAASTVTTTKNDEASADRFLKLLVAQMQNQDPLSPMDNAQVTSQMAQINTVSGIEKLNTSVQGLSGQFMQMQALQGATLVGHDVVVPGDILAVGSGLAQGGFELASAADNVTVEVLAPSGKVLDTIDLGAQTSGLHSFGWPAGTADDSSGLRFRVTARSGATKLAVTPLMRDRVDAVATSGNALTLELQKSGSVPYSTVKAFS